MQNRSEIDERFLSTSPRGHDADRSSGSVASLIRRYLHDVEAGFACGTPGAGAGFCRDPGEPLIVDSLEEFSLATSRGAIRIADLEHVKMIAYEYPEAHPDRWQHGVAFYLPAGRARSARRKVLTELGPDRDAVVPADRKAIVFDLGIGGHNMEFCVRAMDAGLIAILRKAEGRPVFEPGSTAILAILEAGPHRVVRSALGRIEVFQPIGRSNDGPYSFVAPRLLDARRPRMAGIRIPARHVACLHLYPAHPLLDRHGREKLFDANALANFSAILERWGAPEFVRAKARAKAAIEHGKDPLDFKRPASGLARIGVRIAIRQNRAMDSEDELTERWARRFDRSA